MLRHAEESKESITATTLTNLMKQLGRSEDMRSTSAITSPSDVIDDRGTTVLHLVAKQNNLDLIQYLLDSKCDVNAQTSSKTTPLLTAVLYNNFDAAKLLLDSGADMLISNLTNQYPLRLVLNKQRKTPQRVVEYFIRKLKSDVEDNNRVAELLARAGCTLESILIVHDAQLTRALLDHPLFVDVENSTRLVVEYAMKANDLDNLRVILQYGPAALHRRRLFFSYLFYRVYGHNYDWKIVKRYVVQVVEWEIMNDDFLEFWTDMLSKSNAEVLEMMIHWVVDVPSDNKYRQLLLAQAFGELDYRVIELALRNSKIDLNIRGKGGFSLLHFAAMREHDINLNFLLDNGVSPNIKDDAGRTPLFVANNSKCIELLLRYDADVQSIDNNGKSAFDDPYFIPKIEIMQAHLTMLEVQGVSMNPCILNKVKSSIFYPRYRQQLDEMKNHRVFESITLFDVLVRKPEKLVRYLWDRDVALEIENYSNERKFVFYYRSRINYNLNETRARYQTMVVIADVMNEITGKPVDIDHLVVVKITSFINFNDMSVLS